MPVEHIQHILIHTDDVEGVAHWFEGNLGLLRGDHPDFHVPVVWLYARGVPVIHIGQVPREGEIKRFQDNYLGGRKSTALSGSGVIDHVAFHCTGLREIIGRLERGKVRYLKRQAGRDEGLFQLFCDGPCGMRVELNFDAAEARAAGIDPDLTAREAIAAA